MSNDNKVLMIGLDGATFDLIKPWINEGNLPNLKKLIEKGAHGTLTSTVPPLSPVAWTSMSTGCNPGKHGIYDFIARKDGEGYSVKFVDGTDRKVHTIWHILNEVGKKSVGVLNVPISYPPDPVDKWMISGLGTPSVNSPFIHPPELHDELKEKFGEYILEAEFDQNTLKNETKLLKSLLNVVSKRGDIAEFLIKKNELDFIFVVFTISDRVQHHYFKYVDPKHPQYNGNKFPENPVLEAYKMLDSIVGKLKKAAGDEVTTFIVSDHGFGPVYKYVSLNDWLFSKGYLCLRNGFNDHVFARSKFTAGSLKKVIPVGIKIKIKRLFRKYNVKGEMKLFQNLDWQKTIAFSEGVSGGIFINTVSKDLGGAIDDPEKYEQVRGNILNELMTLKDPENGDEVVEKIFKKEDVFSGELIENAPDLIVQFKKGYTAAKPNFAKLKVFEPDNQGRIFWDQIEFCGDHQMNGILIMQGPHVREGYELKGANILDIAPTLLYLMNIPISNKMDGKILNSCIEKDYLNKNQIKKFNDDILTKLEGDMNYSNAEEDLLKERLRGLGYLD